MFKNRHIQVKLVQDPVATDEDRVARELSIESVATHVKPIVKMLMIGTIITVASVVTINVLGEVAISAIETRK